MCRICLKPLTQVHFNLLKSAQPGVPQRLRTNYALLPRSGRGAFRGAARRVLSAAAEGAIRPARGNGRAGVAPSSCSAPSCRAGLRSRARGAQDRHHARAREAVLIHQVADHLGSARRPTRPFRLFIGGDQAHLRLQPANVGWIVRSPHPVNELPRAGKLRVAIDQDRVASITQSQRRSQRVAGRAHASSAQYPIRIVPLSMPFTVPLVSHSSEA